MNERDQKPRIFLSYTAGDKKAANEVTAALNDAGCAVFSAMDPSRISFDDRIADSVREMMMDCDAMVLVASPDAIQSQWTAFEFGAAMAWGKPIYAIATGGAPLPMYLHQVTVISVAELPTLADRLRRETEPLTAAELKVLSKVYSAIGIATDQLLMDPNLSERLTREFNRHVRGKASTSKLTRELVRMRKAGSLPKLGRSTRAVKKWQPAKKVAT